MSRKSKYHHAATGDIVDFFDYARPRTPAPQVRSSRSQDWKPIVVDDLSDHIPITEAELDIIETHFADLLDELFGARR